MKRKLEGLYLEEAQAMINARVETMMRTTLLILRRQPMELRRMTMDQPELWKSVKMNMLMISVASGQPKMGLKQGRSVKSDGVVDEVNNPGGRFCFGFVLAPWRYDADMESLVAWFLVLVSG
jgi:hypothetical protein